MDTGSRFNKGFTDEDEEDDDLGKTGAPSAKEVTVRGQEKSNAEDKATTLRQKHSATEQRRRSKINDRFQILRDLIPHSDQKRDKASFLLEVIEYIQFLHEKVQRYETECQGWNQDNTKLMPWRGPHGFGNTMGRSDACHATKNGSVPVAFALPGDDSIHAPVNVTLDRSLSTSENVSSGLVNQASSIPAPSQPYACSLGFSQPHHRLSPDSENVASQSHAQWLGPVSASASDPLNEQELTIDEGTISISNAYSQWLLSSLSQALHNSGIDTSEASISVQINLGKRALNRPDPDMMDLEDHSLPNQEIGDLRVGSSEEELEHGSKRPKVDKNP